MLFKGGVEPLDQHLAEGGQLSIKLWPANQSHACQCLQEEHLIELLVGCAFTPYGLRLWFLLLHAVQ